jgi:hypothetical protein
MRSLDSSPPPVPDRLARVYAYARRRARVLGAQERLADTLAAVFADMDPDDCWTLAAILVPSPRELVESRL